MKKKILILISLLFAFSVFCQNPYLNTPTSKEYPNADVLVLKEKLSFVLKANNELTKKVEKVEKVLTYQAFDLIGDPHISYDKENQNLEFKKLRTYQIEGKVVDAKQNSFNEMTPFELERCPDYTNIRQVVATKVGLDINSVVETEYEIKDLKPFKRFLDESLLISNPFPTLEKEIEIVVPSNVDLHYLLLNSDEKFSIRQDGNNKIYSLTFKNLQPIYYSECSQGEQYLTPFLIFTTAPDWAHQATILNALIKKSLSSQSKTIEEKVKEITSNIPSLKDKARAIDDFVVTKFTTANWDLSDFDFTPRAVNRIYETGYGNCIDKALLLSKMLDFLGLKSTIYLCTQKPIEATNLPPSLSIFDSAIVSTNVDGETFLFNPLMGLDEFAQKYFADKVALKIDDGTSSLMKFPQLSKANLLTCTIALTPQEEISALKGVAAVSLSGSYANYEGFLKGGADAKANSLLKSILPQVKDVKVKIGKLESENIDYTAEFSIDVKDPAEKKKIDGILLTSLPDISLINENDLYSKEEREMPKILQSTGKEIYQITFEDPQGYKIFNDIKEINFNGGLSLSQKFLLDGKKKTITLEVKALKNMISQGEYKELRKATSLLLSEGYRNIYLEKENETKNKP